MNTSQCNIVTIIRAQEDDGAVKLVCVFVLQVTTYSDNLHLVERNLIIMFFFLCMHLLLLLLF